MYTSAPDRTGGARPRRCAGCAPAPPGRGAGGDGRPGPRPAGAGGGPRAARPRAAGRATACADGCGRRSSRAPFPSEAQARASRDACSPARGRARSCASGTRAPTRTPKRSRIDGITQSDTAACPAYERRSPRVAPQRPAVEARRAGTGAPSRSARLRRCTPSSTSTSWSARCSTATQPRGGGEVDDRRGVEPGDEQLATSRNGTRRGGSSPSAAWKHACTNASSRSSPAIVRPPSSKYRAGRENRSARASRAPNAPGASVRWRSSSMTVGAFEARAFREPAIEPGPRLDEPAVEVRGAQRLDRGVERHRPARGRRRRRRSATRDRSYTVCASTGPLRRGTAISAASSSPTAVHSRRSSRRSSASCSSWRSSSASRLGGRECELAASHGVDREPGESFPADARP